MYNLEMIFLQNKYWVNKLKDIYSFNNFLINCNSSKIFDKIKYDFSKDMVDLDYFLTENNVSFFEFYTSIISLYLSRTCNGEGIIFTYSNLNSDDTLFKIKYDDNISILDFLISMKNMMDNALDNSMENLKDYVNELYPDYCEYIFNYALVNQTKDAPIKGGINSSIIFNISKDSIEVEYDINTFSTFEIESMLENVETIVNNCLNDVHQLCGEMDIICSRQLNLLEEYSKSTDFKIDYKSIPEYINEMTEKYPDNFAINDKQIELHIKN